MSAGGEWSTLLTSGVQLGAPAASPSGRAVAVIEALSSTRGMVGGPVRLARDDGPFQTMDALGADVTALTWLDEKRLAFVGVRGLETVAGVYDTDTGRAAERWVSSDTGCGAWMPEASWAADGTCLLVEDGYDVPHRLVIVRPDGPEVLASISHDGTDYLRKVAGTARAIRWSSTDGTLIEGLLCTPHTQGPHPLVVNLHGGPVWSFRNSWSLVHATTPLLVAEGYAVLCPNPRGSWGRGQQFTSQVFGDVGGGDALDVLTGVDTLISQGLVDPARVGVMGGSYGGYLTSWLVTQDQRWKAAVAVSPVTNWVSQHGTSNIGAFDLRLLDDDVNAPGSRFHARSPVTHARRVTTPCLSIAGALDRCTPPSQAQEMHQALREQGVESQLVTYPLEGHGVRAFPTVIDYSARILDWFHSHMSAEDQLYCPRDAG